jgi:hypothetical protein
LVTRRRGNGGNAYLPVAGIERPPSGAVDAGNITNISGLDPCSIGFGSRIRHYETPCIGLWIAVSI